MRYIILPVIFTVFLPLCGGPRALVFGVTGQDGYYLSHFLLERGYEVVGVVSRPETLSKCQDYATEIKLQVCDIRDAAATVEVITQVQPDEIYNLAAQTNVAKSWEDPKGTMAVNAEGLRHILDAVVAQKSYRNIRVLHASSAEIFGAAIHSQMPQDENTCLCPSTPYGRSKAHAQLYVKEYRHKGVFVASAILYNHESRRRGQGFLTQKVALAAAKIAKGQQQYVELGNINTARDWGYAPDYIEAMWLTLQQDVANDYIISSGTQHSVRAFIEAAFAAVGITLRWQGAGVEEIGINEATGDVVVKINSQFYRPNDPSYLLGNANRAQLCLGWAPRHTFSDIVTEMVVSNLEKIG